MCKENEKGRIDGEKEMVEEKSGELKRMLIKEVIREEGDNCSIEVEGKLVVENILVMDGFEVLEVNIEENSKVGKLDIENERNVKIIENVKERKVEVSDEKKKKRIEVKRWEKEIGDENKMKEMMVMNLRMSGSYDVGWGWNSSRRS